MNAGAGPELLSPPGQARPPHGGAPARRAVIRWSWRLFRREWRQQLLVLALIVVAVAATFIGAAVATNTPPPAGAGFGSARDMSTLAGGPRLTAQIAALRQRYGRVDVIENQALTVPGTVTGYQLRAQDPRGPFGGPMLTLVSGHYPAGPSQVALTSGLAAALRLTTGSVWSEGGRDRRVTGIVANPQSLLDQFALVTPGQVSTPSQVIALFDAPPGSARPGVLSRAAAAQHNPINPETIVVALATVGLLLIALVSAGGFTVLAQRRLRSLGVLGALGGTGRHIRLVVRANGVVVGLAGTLAGFVVGLAGWLAWRPSVEADSHHVIGVFQLPWLVIGLAMALAVLAAYLAAAQPARVVSRIPVVAALSGRPAPPRPVHRSAVPGVAFLAGSFGLFVASGGSDGDGLGLLEVAAGFVTLIVAVVLLAPACLATLARLSGHAPVGIRLALRDLARYRARSSSALAAISLGIMIAVVVAAVTAARFGNVLDYTGPNLAASQILVTVPPGPGTPAGPGVKAGPGAPHPSGAPRPPSAAAAAAAARRIAAALGARDLIELDTTSAMLQRAAPGRNWSGQVYLATPALLRAFGISSDQLRPDADILTARPGLAGTSKMQLLWGDYGSGLMQGGAGPGSRFPCPPGSCRAGPVIQEVSALPTGTAAPNTVITTRAAQRLGLHPRPAGWLLQAAHPPTAAQLRAATLIAASTGLTIETKSSQPSAAEIINWATVFGILLALSILAMTTGLIRSETAADLRTLTATGASRQTRRLLTAVTAGGLALLGAVVGTAAGYLAAAGWFLQNSFSGGLGALSSVPALNLVIIVAGMPLAAAAAGWLLGGRQPAG
jgi:putative ABC transport system permease protein